MTNSITAQDPGPTPEAENCSGASFLLDLAYGAAATVSSPILLYKSLRTGKYRSGWGARFGNIPERPQHNQRIWIHSVSVGETITTKPLVKSLQDAMPKSDIVVSATTDTGLEVAQKQYSADQTFRYPLDFSFAVKKGFNRTKPSLIVLMELEVWPNFTAEAAKRNIPVVVVNGRITERSARRYKKFWPFVGPSFRRVRFWLVQTQEYADRLLSLGIEENRIAVAGNLKFDAVDTTPTDPSLRSNERAALGFNDDATVIIGGSTHPSEEATLLKAYGSLITDHPTLRLILTPRHPHRLPAVEEEIKAVGFECLRLSEIRKANTPPASDIKKQSVILVDTMGELGKLYRSADIAFIGGSLIPHGGQNVLEPAGFGLPTLFGPHMHNFKEAVDVLTKANACRQIPDADNLLPQLKALIEDAGKAKAMGEKAKAAIEEQKGAAIKSAEYLKTLILK